MYLLNVHVLGVSVDVHLELTFHSGLVGGDGGTLDTNIVLPDGLSTLHSHYRKEGKHAVHVKLGQNSRPEINQIHMYMYMYVYVLFYVLHVHVYMHFWWPSDNTTCAWTWTGSECHMTINPRLRVYMKVHIHMLYTQDLHVCDLSLKYPINHSLPLPLPIIIIERYS